MNEMTNIASIETLLPQSGSLSLSLPEGLPFDRWQDLGRELAAREKVLNWWIGDWWAFGEHRYGERAETCAKDLFPQSFGTLRNIGSVARAFPATSRQHDVLSFTHHQEVAPLARQSPDAAEELLDRAEREHMTVSQVRAAVRIAQGRTADEVLAAREEDPDHYALLTIARAWNRAPIAARQSFLDLANEARLEDIDP